MLIDWFTVVAQAINFLILVWLLKRFLYQPILRAIDEREKRVAAQLQQADAKMTEAQKERDEFDRKNSELDQQRQTLLAKAEKDANAERQRLVDEARKQATALSQKLRQSLQNDQQNLNRALVRRVQEEVFAIARKTLADLATTNLEERMAEVFVRRLRELNGEAKQQLISAVQASKSPLIVRSAFDLPSPQQAQIENAVKGTLHATTPVQFETTPGLVSGIELAAGGQKVGWSIADYLASLEKDVGEIVTPHVEDASQADPHRKVAEDAGQ